MKAVYKQLVEKSVWAPAAFALRKNVVHDVAMNVGQSKIPSLKSVCQTLVIDPKQMHDRSLEVVHMNKIFTSQARAWERVQTSTSVK